jgi:hypothetical protein
VKKLFFSTVLTLFFCGCTMNHVKSVQLDPSMLLFNFEGPFISREFADRLAVLVIDQKWPKDVFVRRGPGQVADLGDLWSVTYENALGNANDPIPTSGGKAVPKTLTIRIKKVNGEIVAISS